MPQVFEGPDVEGSGKGQGFEIRQIQLVMRRVVHRSALSSRESARMARDHAKLETCAARGAAPQIHFRNSLQEMQAERLWASALLARMEASPLGEGGPWPLASCC